ncbi:MAG TPA: hypothetical protein VGL42_14810 [Opitutaceae bacterium]
MKSHLPVILLAAALTGSATAQSGSGVPAASVQPATSTISFAADVPLVETEGIPCFQARLGDGPAALFAIDTGNLNSALDSKAAAAAKLATSALPSQFPATIRKAIVPAFSIGSVQLSGIHALVLDFPSEHLPTSIAGFIAYPAFAKRVVQLDYVAKRIRISDVLTAPASVPEPSDSFAMITFGKEGPPIVVASGFELAGKPLTAQIDTAYTGSLLIYTASISKLGLDDLAKTTNTVFFPYTDGGVKMRVAPSAPATFHGQTLGTAAPQTYFPTEGVHEPDALFDGTVGTSLFAGAVVTLDFYDHRLSIVRPVSKG